MKLRNAIVLTAVMLAGCSSELSRKDARNNIRERLAAAGLYLGEEPWSGIEIRIETILQPNDTDRQVFYRLATETKKSGVYQDVYMRSDAGWSLTKPDSRVYSLAIEIEHAGRLAPYSTLVTYLDRLSHALDRWSAPATRLASVPPRSELEPEVSADSLPPDLVSWGVYPDEEPLLIWVTDPANPERVCVMTYDEDLRLPDLDDFAWVWSVPKYSIWAFLRGSTATCNGGDGEVYIPTDSAGKSIDHSRIADGYSWLD